MARVGISAYRDFWDLPRIFILKWRKRLILFDCPFDENTEDFADHFLVYELPMALARRLAPPASWIGLADHGKYLGRVPVKEVSFDRTRRGSIDDRVLEALRVERPDQAV